MSLQIVQKDALDPYILNSRALIIYHNLSFTLTTEEQKSLAATAGKETFARKSNLSKPDATMVSVSYICLQDYSYQQSTLIDKNVFLIPCAFFLP